MKAVIVEIRGETAAALGRDGSVFKVKNRSYAVGQTIDVRRSSLSRQLAVLAACAAAIFLLVGSGLYAYLAPYSLVSLDVNPSLQYTLNRMGLVLSVEAVNGDGDELLAEMEALQNRSIEDAISITVRQIAEDGYFDGDEPGGMVIAASSRSEQEAARLAENARETALRATEEIEKKVVVAAVTVAEDKVQAAKELGVSPGKLTLVEQLKETASDPESIDFKEWLEKPVKDIMKETAAQQPQSGAPASEAPSSGEAAGSAPASSAEETPSSGGQSASEPAAPSLPESEAPSSAAPRPLEPKPSKPEPEEPQESEAPAESGEAVSGAGGESSEGSASSSGALSESGGASSGGSSEGSASSESTSHEAPSSNPGTPLEPSDGWTPPYIPSSSSSRSSSSGKDLGYRLPYASEASSRPWWETLP